jgi:hypothetical protein
MLGKAWFPLDGPQGMAGWLLDRVEIVGRRFYVPHSQWLWLWLSFIKIIILFDDKGVWPLRI